jgi:hypothetical protein
MMSEEKRPRVPSGCGFCQKRCATGLFGAGAEALEEPAEDEQDRSPDADLFEGGQQADSHGGAAHEQQGGDQDPFAAQPVAEVGEEQPAKGPGQESDGVGAEGSDQASFRRDRREEDLAENER